MWAVAIVLVWLGLVAIDVLLSQRHGDALPLCLLRRLTSLPCPTCGATRGVLALLHGQAVQAWLYNPLVFTLGAAAALDALGRALFARRVEITLSPVARRWAWIIAVVLLLVNWAYVIVYHALGWW